MIRFALNHHWSHSISGSQIQLSAGEVYCVDRNLNYMFDPIDLWAQ
jgi:hypothetical protein